MNWTTSQRTPFQILRKYLPQIIPIIDKNITSPFTHHKLHTFINNNPAHLMHDKIIHEYYNIHPERIFNQCPKAVQPHLPSLMQSPVPTTLIKPCRIIENNRLNNLNFSLSFRRSHRIPLFPPNHQLTCPCGKDLDIYGDHLFHCRSHSKKAMHNTIRDSLHTITSTLGPYASFITNTNCCKKEEEDLLPSFPLLRPGDVTIHTTDDPLAKLCRHNHPITAIDCTTTPALTHRQSNPSSFQEATHNHISLHLKCEKGKYNRGPYQINKKTQICGETITKEINDQNITLLALTFDDFGAKGPQACKYLTDQKKTPTITNPKELESFTNEGRKAYKKATNQKRYSALLPRANKGWKKLHNETWFGATYQVTHPSRWAEHHLAQNTNIAILNHIKYGLSTIEKHHTRTKKKNNPVGKLKTNSKAQEPAHRKVKRRHKKNFTKNHSASTKGCTSISTRIKDLILTCTNSSTLVTNNSYSKVHQNH